jgi:hypothetical protein
MEQHRGSGKMPEIFSVAVFGKTATKEFQRSNGTAIE